MIEFKPPHVFVKVNDESRMIGEIHDRILYLKRDSSKHIMRKWDAYGINAELIKGGLVDSVEIEITDRKETLFIDVEDIKRYGRIHKDEDWEEQYFIGIRDMIKV